MSMYQWVSVLIKAFILGLICAGKWCTKVFGGLSQLEVPRSHTKRCTTGSCKKIMSPTAANHQTTAPNFHEFASKFTRTVKGEWHQWHPASSSEASRCSGVHVAGVEGIVTSWFYKPRSKFQSWLDYEVAASKANQSSPRMSRTDWKRRRYDTQHFSRWYFQMYFLRSESWNSLANKRQCNCMERS